MIVWSSNKASAQKAKSATTATRAGKKVFFSNFKLTFELLARCRGKESSNEREKKVFFSLVKLREGKKCSRAESESRAEDFSRFSSTFPGREVCRDT